MRLCGVKPNRYNKQDEAVIIQDIKDQATHKITPRLQHFRRVNSQNPGNMHREPSSKNWVKMRNLSFDSLNQMKVKLTDTTGRKLRSLQPEITIWIKIRQGKEEMKIGGVDPIEHNSVHNRSIQFGRY
eukprot:g5479.t1